MFLLVLLLTCWLPLAAYSAGNEAINPLPVDEFNQPTADFYQDLRTFLNNEIPDRDKENKMSFAVVQGGSHPTSASMISLPFSTIAYTNWQNRVNQPPASINYTLVGCNDDDTGWVIISARVENTLAQFQRVPGTDYFVDCTSTLQPTLPDNAAWLMRVQFTAGAITTAEGIGNVVVAADTVFTVTTNLTTNSTTQWYIAPGGRIRVAPGVTLTFGACPNAGVYHIFEAMNDATSGVVDFQPWACQNIWPEWWGADPTGTVDSTLVWRQVVLRARTETPIHCHGNYLISDTLEDAFPAAITLIGFEQIVGKFRQNLAPGLTTILPCRFTFVGNGNAFSAGAQGDSTNRPNIWLQNLFIMDRDNTGNRGLDFWGVRGGGMRDVIVYGFHTGMWLGSLYYYGSMEGITFDESRVFCADMSGAAFNGPTFIFLCNTQSLTLDTGIRIGAAPGLYGQGHSTTLYATIETYAGIALEVARQSNFRFSGYIETYGTAANHNTQCKVCFHRITGGDINLTLNWSGAPTDPVPVGIRVIGTGATADAHSRNIRFSGYIDSGFTIPLRIDADPAAWGFDTSALVVLNDTLLTLGAHTTGMKIGNNIITTGGVPVANQGRGSDNEEEPTNWQVGDLLWQLGPTSTGGLTNLIRIVNTAGNPPAAGQVSSFLFPSLTPTTIAAATVVPSVKTNQIYNTRFNVEAGGTISNFTDGVGGQCIWLRALGARRVEASATVQLVTTPFDMTANDILYLCLESGIWREYTRTNYP